MLVDEALTQPMEAEGGAFNLALLGGYSVYDHRCAMFLLAPEAAGTFKRFLEETHRGPAGWLRSCVPLAADGSLLKLLFVATEDVAPLRRGAVYTHSLGLSVPVPVARSTGALLTAWGRALSAGRHRWNAVEGLSRFDLEGAPPPPAGAGARPTSPSPGTALSLDAPGGPSLSEKKEKTFPSRRKRKRLFLRSGGVEQVLAARAARRPLRGGGAR